LALVSDVPVAPFRAVGGLDELLPACPCSPFFDLVWPDLVDVAEGFLKLAVEDLSSILLGIEDIRGLR
jgi:hypothetical protein